MNRCVPAGWARALREDTVGLLFVTICQQGVTALACKVTEGDLICFGMNYKYSAAVLSNPSWCRGWGQGCGLSFGAGTDGIHVLSHRDGAVRDAVPAVEGGEQPTRALAQNLQNLVLLIWQSSYLSGKEISYALLSNSFSKNFHKECIVWSIAERFNSEGIISVQTKS